MVHGVRAAMQSLKKTGTDFSSARGMDPKAFFEVMGMFLPDSHNLVNVITHIHPPLQA